MELQAEQDLVAIIKMQPVFGKHAHLVWAYLELFGIAPMKAKTKKIRIILEEMKTLFQAEAFNFQKKSYRISLDGIAEALNTIVHRHFDMPLKSHGYLKSIMVTISGKQTRESGKQGERDLRQREERLMTGYDRPEEQVEAPKMKTVPPGHLTEEQIEANRKRLREMMRQIGG